VMPTRRIAHAPPPLSSLRLPSSSGMGACSSRGARTDSIWRACGNSPAASWRTGSLPRRLWCANAKRSAALRWGSPRFSR
jgi:hypothetical protein